MPTTGQIVNMSQVITVSSNRGATGVTRTGTVSNDSVASMSLSTLTTPSISKIAFKSGTITATNSIELDLTDGSMEDLAGVSGVIFTEIVSISVSITSGTTLAVGGTASNVNQLWFSNGSDAQEIELNGCMFLQGVSRLSPLLAHPRK